MFKPVVTACSKLEGYMAVYGSVVCLPGFSCHLCKVINLPSKKHSLDSQIMPQTMCVDITEKCIKFKHSDMPNEKLFLLLLNKKI